MNPNPDPCSSQSEAELMRGYGLTKDQLNSRVERCRWFAAGDVEICGQVATRVVSAMVPGAIEMPVCDEHAEVFLRSPILYSVEPIKEP